MKYIHIYRIPQCMSPRRNWDSPSPSPLPQASVPHPVTKVGGGQHSPAGEGVGESPFRRLEKKLSTLPPLWNVLSVHKLSIKEQRIACCSSEWPKPGVAKMFFVWLLPLLAAKPISLHLNCILRGWGEVWRWSYDCKRIEGGGLQETAINDENLGRTFIFFSGVIKNRLTEAERYTRMTIFLAPILRFELFRSF